jgi:hypothetical protein
MVDNKALRNFVLDQLPVNIITYIVEGISKIYQKSFHYVFENFDKEQAIDLLPYYRRTEIESFFRSLSNPFPVIKTNCDINNSLNSFHVEICINLIVITQSFCKFPDEKVRDAKFRNTLSEVNIQEKFNFGDSEIIEKADKYFAILQHGAEGREPKIPQFFNLVFPSKSNENIAAPIDILKLYNISTNVLHDDIESIKSKDTLINPPLKTPAKTGESEE